MRTDIRLFRLEKFGFPTELAAGTKPPPPLLTAGVELAGQTATVNSQPFATTLKEKWAKRGVVFGSLDSLVHEHSDLIRRNLYRAVDPAADKFAALHAACWSGGTFLYVPRGVVIDEPLHMITGLVNGSVDLNHTLVIVDEGAEATLLAETAGDDRPGLHCGAIELLLGSTPKLRFVNLQHWGSGVWHFAHQNALVDRDARLQWTIGALGSRLAKVNQHVSLVGEHAIAQVNGVMFTEGKQHLSYHTLQHHRRPTARATCSTKVRCRTNLASCGAA